MTVYSLVYSVIYWTLMTMYKMNLRALQLLSCINSQLGLGLIDRCRRAAKVLWLLWLSLAWCNVMQNKAMHVCQILCWRSLFCLVLYINRRLPSQCNISQKFWNVLSHSFKAGFLPFLPVLKVLFCYRPIFMSCGIPGFFFVFFLHVFNYFVLCANFCILKFAFFVSL